MEVVGFVPGLPTSRLFNREYEKTPSPEKEEKEEETSRLFNREYEKTPGPEEEDEEEDEDEEDEEEDVLDLTYLELEYDALKVSFADELVVIEERMAGVATNLPQFKPGEDGKVMELVSQELIRAIMKSPPHPKPLPDYSIEALRRDTGITDEVVLESVASAYRGLQSARDIHNDIIRQYRAQGYAYASLPEPKRYQPPASGN